MVLTIINVYLVRVHWYYSTMYVFNNVHLVCLSRQEVSVEYVIILSANIAKVVQIPVLNVILESIFIMDNAYSCVLPLSIQRMVNV